MVEAQPFRWRVEHQAWPTSDDVMARCAHRARKWSRDATEDLVAADVRETKSRSLAPRRVQHCGRRNRVVMDVGSSEEGSVIDLTSTGTVRVTGSDEEE
ncbi:putative methyltransferase PMT17 [Hordeum vulgare]|nr:putative methyltransferase PMT17 [Hordeum vulgare]